MRAQFPWKPALRSLATALCLIALFENVPAARAQGTTGTLGGTATDAGGAPLPGATVTLTNTATSQSQTATTGANGRYEFPSLAPGAYDEVISAAGFQAAAMTGVTVNVSEDTTVNAQLAPGSADKPTACQCVVTHTASSSTGTLVDSKAITAVPLTTRNFTQVLSTASGRRRT